MTRTILLFTLALSAATLVLPLRAQESTPAGPPTAASTAHDDFKVLGTAVGYVRTENFLKFMSDAEAGIKQPGMFDGRGPLAILLLVFVGGLALNLTP